MFPFQVVMFSSFQVVRFPSCNGGRMFPFQVVMFPSFQVVMFPFQVVMVGECLHSKL